MLNKVIPIEQTAINSIKGEFVKFIDEIKHNGKPIEKEKYLLSKEVIKPLVAKPIWTDEDIFHAEEIVIFILGH